MSTGFGNGPVDQQHFQLDNQRPEYLRQKSKIPPQRHAALQTYENDHKCQVCALDWAWKTLSTEYPSTVSLRPHGDIVQQWSALSDTIQADIAVISSPPNDRIITTWISFPSGWAPERILGQSFWGLHGPVPTFANQQRTAQNLARAMCNKGPFVRFVWTVCGDDQLDHHPNMVRPFWSGHNGGFLRVERQLTVPLGMCAVFLIRTYLYPLDGLSTAQRTTLSRSLAAMPPSYARYKGLTALNPVLTRRLESANRFLGE